MDGTSLANMPPEILAEILAFLEPKTMLLCSSVSHMWHDTVTGSPVLQCAIELWVDGLIGGDPGASTPTDTLRAIHQRRRAWNNLDWTSRTTIGAESLEVCRAYELVGGIFAQQEQGPHFCAISLADVDVVDVGPDKARVKHPLRIDPAWQFHDFAMDPTQDLLAVLYQPAPDIARLECRTLSSHHAHPLAPWPLFTFPLHFDPEMALSIQIADDVIALSFPDPHHNRFILWNWRKGIQLEDISRRRSWRHVADFQLLSPRSFILAFAAGFGRIEIHTFEGVRAQSTTHVATLRLPELLADIVIARINIFCGPFCANPMPRKPFSTSNERRIYVILMNYSTSGWNRLVVHHRTLQKYVLDCVLEIGSPVDVPWDDWGPQNAAMLPAFDFRWLRHVHGERIVLPMPDADGIQLLDFGVIPRRPGVADPPPQSDTGVNTVLHFEPATRQPGEPEVFAHAVTTSLPFRSTQRFMGDDSFHVLLLDQDRIVGVNFNVRG
ncbi:hypothetical protein B0H11DRAFT_1750935 [Mycena galericulata]|nr:hypothetical protein B0H11DRAFT_1750935 [Mycena galericulata]